VEIFALFCQVIGRDRIDLKLAKTGAFAIGNDLPPETSLSLM
jgi:hypothetical protein